MQIGNNKRKKDFQEYMRQQIMEPLREFKKEEYAKNPLAEKLDYQLLVHLNEISSLFAQEAGVPEEEFMPCDVLSEIFTRRPKSVAALKRIDGMDPEVAACYGLTYVNLIKEHSKLEKKGL